MLSGPCGTLTLTGLGVRTLKAEPPGRVEGTRELLGTGFGETGPDTQRPAFDQVVPGMGGIFSMMEILMKLPDSGTLAFMAPPAMG